MTRKLVFIVATLGLVAAACGDSGDTATGDVDSVATSTSASVAETTSVAPSSRTTADVETTTTEAAPTSLIVMADDGEAVLEIPPGALPSGVDPASIRISRTESLPAGVGEDLEAAGLELVRTYELLPDGIVFAQPAVLRVPVDQDSGLLTTAFLIGDSEIQALEFLEEEPATDSTIGILVPHFSVITVVIGRFKIDLTWPDRPVVDKPFVVTRRVYRVPGTASFENFTIGGYLADLDGGLEPHFIGAPEITSDGPSSTTNFTFKCTKLGKETIENAVSLRSDPDDAVDLMFKTYLGLERTTLT